MANKIEVIEKIAEWLAIEHGKTRLQFKKYLEPAQELADYICVLGYVQKAEDQSLPKSSIYVPSESDCETNEVNHISRYYYLMGQQDILKANFVKVEKE